MRIVTRSERERAFGINVKKTEKWVNKRIKRSLVIQSARCPVFAWFSPAIRFCLFQLFVLFERAQKEHPFLILFWIITLPSSSFSYANISGASDSCDWTNWNDDEPMTFDPNPINFQSIAWSPTICTFFLVAFDLLFASYIDKTEPNKITESNCSGTHLLSIIWMPLFGQIQNYFVKNQSW